MRHPHVALSFVDGPLVLLEGRLVFLLHWLEWCVVFQSINIEVYVLSCIFLHAFYFLKPWILFFVCVEIDFFIGYFLII